MYTDFLIYIFFFVIMWIGSGLIVNSVSNFAKGLDFSPFIVSFFVLGITTSFPEIVVGVNSILKGTPEIFVGNLLGGVFYIFFFVIPFLALIGNGIKINRQITKKTIIFSIFIIIFPLLVISDKFIHPYEGFFALLTYLSLFIFHKFKTDAFLRFKHLFFHNKINLFLDTVKFILGLLSVYLSSSIIVDKTIWFSQVFSLSPFLISLFAVSVGTNLPELFIAIRGVVSGHKEIALGDYFGSACANTLIFGILTLFNMKPFSLINGFEVLFILMLLGFVLFYYFAMSDKNITKSEGFLLFLVYVSFVLFELSLRIYD